LKVLIPAHRGNCGSESEPGNEESLVPYPSVCAAWVQDRLSLLLETVVQTCLRAEEVGATYAFGSA